jgi:acyl-CoA synthetase (AMP-forming)/AMP-acid ligase II
MNYLETNIPVWQINDLSNKVAHIFEDGGFKPGDTVALFLDNRPEYVAIWLGLAKAGIITALINHNLRGSPLSHSINIVDSKAVIFGAEFTKGKTCNFLTK